MMEGLRKGAERSSRAMHKDAFAVSFVKRCSFSAQGESDDTASLIGSGSGWEEIEDDVGALCRLTSASRLMHPWKAGIHPK